MKEYIPFITRQKVEKIPVEDIIYIMKKGRKIRIVTEREAYEFYENFDEVCKELDKRFYPCLKTYYINLEKVNKMENQTIFYQNGEQFYLGRDNYVRTRQYFSAYLKHLI